MFLENPCFEYKSRPENLASKPKGFLESLAFNPNCINKILSLKKSFSNCLSTNTKFLENIYFINLERRVDKYAIRMIGILTTPYAYTQAPTRTPRTSVQECKVATCTYNLYIQEYVQTATFPNKIPLEVATCAYNLYIQEYVQTATFPNKFPLEVATCAYNLYIQECVQTTTFLQDSESWRTFFRTVCPGNQGLRCFIVMPIFFSASFCVV